MPVLHPYRNCAALLIFVFLGSGCARRPSAPPTRTWPKSFDNCIVGVENFTKVSAALWRGAQPTAEGFRNLKAAGATTILSLRVNHDDWPLLQGTQLRYLRLPGHAWDPEEAQLVPFLKILEDPKNWPVFVHCAEGRELFRRGISYGA